MRSNERAAKQRWILMDTFEAFSGAADLSNKRAKRAKRKGAKVAKEELKRIEQRVEMMRDGKGLFESGRERILSIVKMRKTREFVSHSFEACEDWLAKGIVLQQRLPDRTDAYICTTSVSSKASNSEMPFFRYAWAILFVWIGGQANETKRKDQKGSKRRNCLTAQCMPARCDFMQKGRKKSDAPERERAPLDWGRLVWRCTLRK